MKMEVLKIHVSCSDMHENSDLLSLDQVRRIIDAYEAKYGMSSEEFLRQWEAGTAPDTYETNDWAMLLDAT